MITQYPRIPIPSNAMPDSFVFESTADQVYALGSVLDLEDGRRFRYAKNGGAAVLYKALTASAAAIETKWESIDQVGQTAAVGDYEIPFLITTGSGLAAHEWDEGWMVIESVLAAAIGDIYKIASHTIHATNVTVTIDDPGGLRTALDDTQISTIIRSPYMAVVVSTATALGGQVVGVPLVDIPISYYCWLQTRGPCPLIVDTGETLVLGEPVGYTAAGITVAGTCGKTAVDDPTYGHALTGATATECGIVNLTID